jgi:hypothetical protein
MRLLKTILVFAAGIVAGGLIFGFSGPATSQAGGAAPADMFRLGGNYIVDGKYKQYFYIQDKYKSKYKVVKLGKMSSDYAYVVYLGDR